ncbi:Major facilitator superfamily domain general substrate transporter [Penicillium hispanicum]|uniref:Major facilitator superfamily domain general substrate transporter n=1 Tax=Penicillium hispanicum TaxID=1080232 RepID=UPI00253F9682|nr:Major facilitator superfamily domain general substrate transporter [Penicillium hispanicum]KAJ5570227.1 Major facilitator superfamily domain general substrate transporter [Penicillium hispanicum]
MAWFGYDQGVFSGVLIAADFQNNFPRIKSSNISGITSSCFSVGFKLCLMRIVDMHVDSEDQLGAFFGALFAFTLGDNLGRKKTVTLGLVCNTVGAILQIVSWSLPQLILGRIINGFGMGLTSSTCPVYQAECSKPQVRGKLVVVGSLSNTAAFCLANWINFGLYFQGHALQWRFPLGFQLIFPLIVAVALLFVPESPRWLLLKDRLDESRQVIARLEGKMSPHPVVTDQFLSIQSALEIERRNRVATRDVLLCRDKTQNLRRLLLSCGTQFMQQFSGVNALGYYLPTLLQTSVGLGEEESRLLTAVNGTTYLFAAICCLVIIDRVGRRKLMLYGSLAMGACYLAAAICLKTGVSDPLRKRRMGQVTTAMFFLYYFFYGTSFAKVSWVYNSEVNSLGWRARGAAAATATNWIGSFIVTQFTSVGVNGLHWRFYLSIPLPLPFPFRFMGHFAILIGATVFAIITWCFFPIVFSLYPETSQRTLEDMDEIFIQHPSLIVCGSRDITGRKRPKAFVKAENNRIVETTEMGRSNGG